MNADHRTVTSSEIEMSGLRDIIRLFATRAYIVVPVALASLVLALALAHSQPKQYEATTRLMVEPRMPSYMASAEGMISSSDEVEMRTLALVIRSLPVARRVVGSLALADNPMIVDLIPDADSMSRPDLVEAVSEKVLEMVRVDMIARTRCLDVTVETVDPQLAVRMADTFCDEFIRENVERRRQRLLEAMGVYASRFPEHNRQLEEAEAAIMRFQEENMVVSSEQPEAVLRQRELQLQTQLTDAQKERIARGAIVTQLEVVVDRGVDSHELARTIASDDNWVRQLLDSRLRQVASVAELRKSFSDGHRELESAKARLAEIESELRQATLGYHHRAESAYRAALWKEDEVKALLAEHRDNVTRLMSQIARYEMLRQQRDSLRAVIEPMAKSRVELDLAASMDVANSIGVIGFARLPKSPSRPRRSVYAAVGAVLGVALGFGLAQIIEVMDESVRTPLDVRRASGLDTIGMVSLMSRQLPAAERGLIVDKRPGAIPSEQFRSLRTGLLSRMTADETGRGGAVLVTSPNLGEGKTTVCVNMAAAFAQLGRRTVVVDADLRRSSVHTVAGVPRSPGLVDVLQGLVGLEQALRPTAVENLFVLSAGKETDRPAELLSGEKMREVLDELRAKHGMVLIDSPPVIPVADARNLMSMVDFVAVVARASSTRTRALERMKDLMNCTDASSGVVLNGLAGSLERMYGYGRQSYYAEDAYTA